MTNAVTDHRAEFVYVLARLAAMAAKVGKADTDPAQTRELTSDVAMDRRRSVLEILGDHPACPRVKPPYRLGCVHRWHWAGDCPDCERERVFRLWTDVREKT